MKLKEAYSILELSTTATPEEAKKRYRELTKKYHPDINKEKDADAKFKKINEAYECIKSGKGNDPEPIRYGRNPFESTSYFQPENIKLYTTVSFKESVLGCKRDIKFNRIAKCTKCNGQGEVSKNNGCTSCGGRGQTVTQKGNSVFIQTCNKCYGQLPTEQCLECNSNGTINVESAVNVIIPGGISDGNILRLNGMGNFVNRFLSMDQYTDVHLTIKVIPEPGLTLIEKDVISVLDITLLEALQGCTKTVKTIDGNKDVDVKSMSRHNDKITIPKMGVNNLGNQIVILNVSYPKDVSKIINILTEEGLN